MASTAILTTYGVNDIREDVVLNAIEILTARESQITNLVQRGSAIATVHSYLTDTLKAVASLAVTEQGDYTATEAQTPARLTNVIEIIAKNFKVSRTQQQVQHHHGENELQRQTRKGLMDWANAYEFDFVRSTLTSGASGTAPKMSWALTQCLNGFILKVYAKASTHLSKLQKEIQLLRRGTEVLFS